MRTLIFGLAALSLLTMAGPASAQVVQGEEHCVVNVKSSDVLNVRSMGRVTGEVVTTLRYGECGIVVVGACQGSWCPMEDGHYAGWVHRHFISMVSPSMYCVAGVATNDILNLRAYPSADSRILTTLPPNQCDIAFLPYSTGDWQKVRVNGYEGWVSRSFVSGQ